MKKLLILVLGLALIGALALTRPTQEDFRRFAAQNINIVKAKPAGGVLGQISAIAGGLTNDAAADAYVSTCQFDNDFLWTNVRQNGKTVYTGVLNHWFARGDAKGQSNP